MKKASHGGSAGGIGILCPLRWFPAIPADYIDPAQCFLDVYFYYLSGKYQIRSYSSAHSSRASRTGRNFRPISVKEYSTLGGTSRYTSL